MLLFWLLTEVPKFTDLLLVLCGMVGFIAVVSGAEPSLSGGDFPLDALTAVFSLLIAAAGVWLFAWGLRGGLTPSSAMPIRLSVSGAQPSGGPLHPTPTPEPSAPSVEMTAEEQEEAFRAVMEEARGIANNMRGGREMLERVFERVFRHRCQQRGIRISDFRWKRQS